jgi:hypothetical protein
MHMAHYVGELPAGTPSMGSGIGSTTASPPVPMSPQTNGGYPVAIVAPGTYPNSPLAATTNNPKGVPNSPDEKTVSIAAAGPLGPGYSAYGWKTWEEKAAVTVPAGTFAVVVN